MERRAGSGGASSSLCLRTEEEDSDRKGLQAVWAGLKGWAAPGVVGGPVGLPPPASWIFFFFLLFFKRKG